MIMIVDVNPAIGGHHVVRSIIRNDAITFGFLHNITVFQFGSHIILQKWGPCRILIHIVNGLYAGTHIGVKDGP